MLLSLINNDYHLNFLLGFYGHNNNNNNNNIGQNGSYFRWLATSNEGDAYGL